MTTSPRDFQYDHDAIGVEVEAGEIRITHERAGAYRRATGLLTETSLDPLLAPPGLVILAVSTFSRGLDPRVGGGSGISIVGQHLDLHAPVRVGELLTVRAAVREVYQKTGRSGEMAFINSRTRFLNERGEEVATLDHRYAWHEHPERREPGTAR